MSTKKKRPKPAGSIDMSKDELAFWEYKRRFLIRHLNFSERDAAEGATNAVLAFREADAAA